MVNGFSIVMENPLKTLRKEFKLSQDSVAELSGVSKTAIVRAEQGCYTNIPVGLVKFYTAKWGTQLDGLTSAYENFQLTTRKHNYGRLVPAITYGHEIVHIALMLHELDSKHNPFTWWRAYSHLNKAEVAKLYCVGLSCLNKLESSNPPSVIPGQLAEALIQSGYHPHTVVSLNDNLKRHKNFILESART